MSGYEAMIEEVRFAEDSPLEEAVTSEPVSVWKFPASSEFAGNFARFGFFVAFHAPKTWGSPRACGANSLGIGAGNFYDVAGNSIGQSGNVAAGSGILLCPSRLPWYLRLFVSHLIKSRWLF
jgi:hypothetical protein